MKLGLNYVKIKQRLANNVLKKARNKGQYPPRAILGCIDTSVDSVQFKHNIGRHLDLNNIKDIDEQSDEISLRDIAEYVLTTESVSNCLFEKLERQKVAIDFSSPNIAKPFHAGHLNSTIIGNYLANLKHSLGDEVIRINYLGDWGTQFGILSAAFRKLGSEERLKKEPLNHLVDVYVQGNRLAEQDESFRQDAVADFAKLEADDKEIKQLWWNFRDISLKEYFKIYSKLGIKFDLIQGESAYHKDALELIRKLTKQLKEDNGLRGIVKNDDGFIPLVKSNGSTLYLTRDICAAVARKEKYGVQSIYYVVDSSQTKHFEDLQYCLDLLKERVNVEHVKFGRIRGLSTRKGQVVLLEDLIEEAKERALKRMHDSSTRVRQQDMDKVATELGLSALYTNTLKSRRQKDSVFEWEKCFSLKGDSGIALQYCHARLCSLLSKNEEIEPRFHTDVSDILLQDENVREALILLAKFDECLVRSDATLEPSELVQYLFKLRHAIGKTFNSVTVKGEEARVAETRLLLFVKLQQTLATGLKLLGIRPLQEV